MRNRKNSVVSPRAYRVNPLLRIATLALIVALFLSILGVPYLKVSYKSLSLGGNEIHLFATYWTPGDEFTTSASLLGREHCPLIILRPLEVSLWERLIGLLNKPETLNPSGNADESE